MDEPDANGSTRKTVSVHTGVLLARTKGGRPPGMDVCHNDDHPGHNWVANLRWDTPEGNRGDRYGDLSRPRQCCRTSGNPPPSPSVATEGSCEDHPTAGYET